MTRDRFEEMVERLRGEAHGPRAGMWMLVVFCVIAVGVLVGQPWIGAKVDAQAVSVGWGR